MASLFFDDDAPGPDRAPAPVGTRARAALASVLARFRADPVAAPFRDSDFEPGDWGTTRPFGDEEPGQAV